MTNIRESQRSWHHETKVDHQQLSRKHGRLTYGYPILGKFFIESCIECIAIFMICMHICIVYITCIYIYIFINQPMPYYITHCHPSIGGLQVGSTSAGAPRCTVWPTRTDAQDGRTNDHKCHDDAATGFGSHSQFHGANSTTNLLSSQTHPQIAFSIDHKYP